MEIVLKSVQIEFLDPFHTCLDEVAQEKFYLLLTSAPPKERMREFIEKNIKKNVPQVFAFHGEKMVGWCDIRPFEHETISHRAELGMGVIKDYRGKGIGKMLIGECLKLAKQRGLEIVNLEVFADNDVAIRLYESFGFQKEGLIQRYRKIDGKYQDSVFMSLRL